MKVGVDLLRSKLLPRGQLPGYALELPRMSNIQHPTEL